MAAVVGPEEDGAPPSHSSSAGRACHRTSDVLLSSPLISPGFFNKRSGLDNSASRMQDGLCFRKLVTSHYFRESKQGSVRMQLRTIENTDKSTEMPNTSASKG